MITDLESRLATVLGARLPAPFTGRVTASPAGSPGQEPRIVVATRAADPMQTTLHSQRREVVPGDPAPRRVLRLACELELAVQPAANAGRAQQLQGVDALIHTLDDPEFPAALSGPADPGFLLDTFALGGTQLPAEPAAVTVSVRAAGLFWPVGAPGEMGPQVDTVTLRDASLPVELILPAQPIRATGSAAVIGVRFHRPARSRSTRRAHVRSRSAVWSRGYAAPTVRPAKARSAAAAPDRQALDCSTSSTARPS